MGAEPGRRFLKQPAEKLEAVFVAALSQCNRSGLKALVFLYAESVRGLYH